MPFDPADLPPASLASLLADGSFVRIEDGRDGRHRDTTSAALIDAPPEKVRAVVTDFDRYADWVPQVTRSEVIGRRGPSTDVAFTLSFRFSVFSKSLSYSLRYRETDTQVAWDRLSNEFTENRGTIRWIGLDRGKRTAAFYRFYFDLAGLGPVVKLALKSSPQLEVAISASTAVLMARALKSRVEGLP